MKDERMQLEVIKDKLSCISQLSTAVYKKTAWACTIKASSKWVAGPHSSLLCCDMDKILWPKGSLGKKGFILPNTSRWYSIIEVSQTRNSRQEAGGRHYGQTWFADLLRATSCLVLLFSSGPQTQGWSWWPPWAGPSHVNHYSNNASLLYPQPCLMWVISELRFLFSKDSGLLKLTIIATHCGPFALNLRWYSILW